MQQFDATCGTFNRIFPLREAHAVCPLPGQAAFFIFIRDWGCDEMVLGEIIERFVGEQRATARGQRKELLEGDLAGTKKLLEHLWTVLGSFEGINLEYEFIGANGERNYIDVYYEPLAIGFECEGFVPHAETITRRRFSYERRRVRRKAKLRIVYYPYSKDELDNEPEMCRQDLREIIGIHTSAPGSRAMEQLTVFEREVLRYGLRLMRQLKLEDVKYCLGCKYARARNVIDQLESKNMVKAIGSGTMRFHEYEILPKGKDILLR